MSGNNGTALGTRANATDEADSPSRFGTGPEWLRNNLEDTAPMDAVDRPDYEPPALAAKQAPAAEVAVASGPSTGTSGQVAWSGASSAARKWWQRSLRGSEADQLEAELAEAARLVPIQSDPLLAERMSARERRVAAHAARKVRTAQRKAWEADQLAQVRRGVRSQKLATELADQRAEDERWHQRAESERQRLTSPAVRMGRLARSIRTRRIVFLAVAYAGILWGAFNVHDILTSYFDLKRTDGLYWLSFGVEPLLTVPLVQMMWDRATMASWGRALSWRRAWPIYLVEAALLLGATAIATLPRLGDGKTALLFLVAPVMIAVAMIMLPIGHQQLNEILIAARDDAAEQDALANEESALAKFVARATTVFEAVGRDEISGERDENGVPSASAIRAHQACNKGTAITLRKLMAAARS
jgi:hypothetical protein